MKFNEIVSSRGLCATERLGNWDIFYHLIPKNYHIIQSTIVVKVSECFDGTVVENTNLVDSWDIYDLDADTKQVNDEKLWLIYSQCGLTRINDIRNGLKLAVDLG